MNCTELTKILGQAINDIKADKIDLKKAQTLVKASNSLIKLQCAKIASRKLEDTNLPFFNK